MKQIDCPIVGGLADGLEKPPFDNELGQRIFENISAQGFYQGLSHIAMVINENGLSTADDSAKDFIYQHMLGYFFKEGPFADNGFVPPNPKNPTQES